MSQAAAGVFNQLAGLQELPHVPTAVMEIQESLQAPDVDIPMLAKKSGMIRCLRRDFLKPPIT